MATINTGMINENINGITVNTSVKCNAANYTNKSSRDVKYVVVHYTGNTKDNALSNCNYFKNNSCSSSAHFFVDNTNIYQSVELRDSAWHCGCSKGYKTACRNTNSFGIEMCTSGDYLVSEQTQINAAYVCAYLCKLIGITTSTVDTYVLRHYDVVSTNKKCPAQYVSDSSQFVRFKTWVKNILNTGSHTGTTTQSTTTSSTYTKTQFVKDVQSAIGAKVDGVAGDETLSKTVTVSKSKNNKHAVVKAIQKYLNALGYDCGTADGVAGAKFDTAVKAYQKANGCTSDGEVTAKGKTWKKLLGLA